jgi:molybdenum cofactor biosynthesis enzyme MoaA
VPLADSFGRTVDCLRISITDRCNERCLYCMPESYQRWSQRADHLPLAEFAAVEDVPVRFIELMPLSRTLAGLADRFWSVADAMERLTRKGALAPLPDARLGHGPARYYSF